MTITKTDLLEALQSYTLATATAAASSGLGGGLWAHLTHTVRLAQARAMCNELAERFQALPDEEVDAFVQLVLRSGTGGGYAHDESWAPVSDEEEEKLKETWKRFPQFNAPVFPSRTGVAYPAPAPVGQPQQFGELMNLMTNADSAVLDQIVDDMRQRIAAIAQRRGVAGATASDMESAIGQVVEPE